MNAPMVGSFARRLQASSYVGPHRSILPSPSRYSCAKTDSRCIEVIAAENIAIGCESFGIALRTSKTYCGTFARPLKSSMTSSVCSIVGTSPVSMKYQKLSTDAYSQPGAFGRASNTSGIVMPRKRMPSIGSR